MHSKSLIALVSLISFCCSRHVGLRTAEQITGFVEISKGFQPSSGYFISYEDAIKKAEYDRNVRVNCENKAEMNRSELLVCTKKNEIITDELSKVNNGGNSFLSKWGLPIGLFIGAVIGASVPLIFKR